MTLGRTSAPGPGDTLATLEAWMAAYGADVLNVAYAYVRNYHQAQDIAQDVFLRALTKMESFRGESSVKTWLLSITVNRCKDYLRSWAVRHEVQDEEQMALREAASDTEAEAVNRLERERVWQALQQLPLKYREVVVLYYMRGLPGHEVARVLGISEQNVRTRLHRGRTMLRQMLEEEVDRHERL
ncbi:MAG: sigma-70 family RNA polymerase sigma factor [Alicyclobacillus macrosporangiidus]|nr:sigma-70 family RNA polymerase sigma factor [Alicyclobacillus macrosporangiidus]